MPTRQAASSALTLFFASPRLKKPGRKSEKSAKALITTSQSLTLETRSFTGVVVCDQAPSATSIVEAPGAVVNGNQAVWRFDELKPGEKQNLSITLTTCTPGYFVNHVYVDNCQRCRDCAEWGTRWRGTPALNGCFADTKDPICVGDFNSYTLNVTNQGSEEDTNLRVVLRFPVRACACDNTRRFSGDNFWTNSDFRSDPDCWI